MSIMTMPHVEAARLDTGSGEIEAPVKAALSLIAPSSTVALVDARVALNRKRA